MWLPLATGAFSTASAYGGATGRRLLAALLVTAIFTAWARWLHAVSISGAAGGAVASFVIYAAAGPSAFAALVAVFAVTWAGTRLGYARKVRLQTAENRHGRQATQILANLGVSAVLFALAAWSSVADSRLLIGAALAALAEAAADTASSECGIALSDNVYLITTFRRVPVGTDGGISSLGTLAGVAAALLIAVTGGATGLVMWRWVPAVTAAAVLGMLMDSVLGALLERRGWLNNDAVNLLGTGAGAAAFWLLARLLV